MKKNARTEGPLHRRHEHFFFGFCSSAVSLQHAFLRKSACGSAKHRTFVLSAGSELRMILHPPLLQLPSSSSATFFLPSSLPHSTMQAVCDWKEMEPLAMDLFVNPHITTSIFLLNKSRVLRSVNKPYHDVLLTPFSRLICYVQGVQS